MCRGKSGHAEVVRVEYDSEVVSFEQLLGLFEKMHNPGAGWRQDLESQYRSCIFTTTDEQEAAAHRWKSKLVESGKYRNVWTQIEPAGLFWIAEEYHQRYYEKHKLASCRLK